VNLSFHHPCRSTFANFLLTSPPRLAMFPGCFFHHGCPCRARGPSRCDFEWRSGIRGPLRMLNFCRPNYVGSAFCRCSVISAVISHLCTMCSRPFLLPPTSWRPPLVVELDVAPGGSTARSHRSSTSCTPAAFFRPLCHHSWMVVTGVVMPTTAWSQDSFCHDPFHYRFSA